MEENRKEGTNAIVSVNGIHLNGFCQEMSLNSVQTNAIEIADDIVKYLVGTSALHPTNKYSKTMRRAVGEISRKHELLFQGMAEKLGVTETNVSQVLPVVLDEVFSDGEYNWGRLVTVYAFAGWVARYFARKGSPECATMVGAAAGKYVVTKLASWIECHGGWDGFEMFFAEPESSEKLLLGGLICTVVSVGIGVLASALIVR